jgi:peptidoglycan/LPS O-acetylase OafA/YrhL
VLRGIAVSLVLIRHTLARPDSSEPILFALFQAGWTGVDLFFVLSGFLISGLLFTEAERTGDIGLRRFWLRRGMKIWPSYYAVYGLLAAVQMWFASTHRKPTHAEWLLPNLVFVQNYWPPRQRWPHSWSVAIEEHFYLALPLLLLLLLRRDRLRLLPWIAGAVCAIELALRIHVASRAGTDWQSTYYPTHLRADSLLFGVLLGWAYHHRRAWFDRVARAWPVLLAGMVGVLVMAGVTRIEEVGSAWLYTVGFTLLYLGFGGAVLVAAAYPDAGARNPVARALAWLGVYSYTIYLTHSVVSRFPYWDDVPGFFRTHVVESPWTDRIVFWGASIITGVLASHLIERPFLRLRSRWLPSGASSRPPRESAPGPRAPSGPTSG